jgi:hypothetical protein
MQHINTLSGCNEQCFNATIGSTYNNHFVYTGINKFKNLTNTSDALKLGKIKTYFLDELMLLQSCEKNGGPLVRWFDIGHKKTFKMA